MQVKSIAECSKGEHSAILSTFIKLPFHIKIFLSIFEWLLKTGFTVINYKCNRVLFDSSAAVIIFVLTLRKVFMCG